MCANVKKAKPALQLIYVTVREIGIKAKILPRNFPELGALKLGTVNDKKEDFGGYGGAGNVTKRGKFVEPFIIVNLHSNKTAVDFMSVLAHEMLHIKQTICQQKPPSHNNEFRHDCAEFARLIGVTYWHLNGYDKPALHVFKAIQAKKMRAFLKDNAERKEKKSSKK